MGSEFGSKEEIPSALKYSLRLQHLTKSSPQSISLSSYLNDVPIMKSGSKAPSLKYTTQSCFWVKSLDPNQNPSVLWPLSYAVNCWEILMFKRYQEKGTCFLTLVYVCCLNKNARQDMQKLCRNTIHMVIPLYLNNFF